MVARNTTPDQLRLALAKVNKTFKGNVAFETFEPGRSSVKFTLRTLDSTKPGSRRGQTGRRMAKACWHVHGKLFEALLAINPEAVIISRGGPGAVIDRNGGNWQDANIGSVLQPLMMSEACDCH